MPGGTSQRHLLFTGCRCTACCLFMSVTFTAIHCCKSNQQHREQIGHDVKICLFPLAGLSVCQSYIHLYVSVFLCMFRPISSSFMPTQTLPIPNLAPEFLPTHPHTLSLLCVYPWCYRAPTCQTTRFAGMAAGWKLEPGGLWVRQIGRMY